MEISNAKAPPAPPNIIAALRGGFDAIANRVYIILIPLLLDIWLWLGPHIQIKSLLNGFVESIISSPGFDPAQSAGLLPTDPEILQSIIARINLMTVLRTYPIGIPSLVSGFLPLETPIGSPIFLEVTSPLVVIVLWLFLTLLGLMAGILFFILVAQAALIGQLNLKQAMLEWPRQALQVGLLMLAIVAILLILFVPSSCILSVVTMGSIAVSQIAVIIMVGILLWVFLPISFTPHGIFAIRANLLTAVQHSIVLTRMTMPTTLLFFMVILLASQGLDVLWRVPEENSWFMLVGLAGHAFAASALLASSFVYYRDADQWAQNLVRKISLSRTA